jgi:hypothetical protein
VSQRKVYEWVDRFRWGRTSLVGRVRYVLPSVVTCVKVKGQINRRIQKTRRISEDEVNSEISICYVNKALQDDERPKHKIFLLNRDSKRKCLKN